MKITILLAVVVAVLMSVYGPLPDCPAQGVPTAKGKPTALPWLVCQR
jgi:hypothetical protein